MSGTLMKQLSWQTIAMVAVIGGMTVALGTFTNWSPNDITSLAFALTGLAVGGVIGGGMAGGVASKVDEVHALNVEQSKTLDTVERHTNGDLDKRIAAAVDESHNRGREVTLEILREQGLIE